MTLKDEISRSVGAQYATGEEWRKSSRKNEETELKQKQDWELTVVQIILFILFMGFSRQQY